MTHLLTPKVDSEAIIETRMLKTSQAIAANSGYWNSFPFQKASMSSFAFLSTLGSSK